MIHKELKEHLKIVHDQTEQHMNKEVEIQEPDGNSNLKTAITLDENFPGDIQQQRANGGDLGSQRQENGNPAAIQKPVTGQSAKNNRPLNIQP